MNDKRCPLALNKCGVALYGQNWKNPLAHALGVNPGRIRAWLADKYEMPPGVWLQVIELLKQRKIDIDALLSEIDCCVDK